MTLLSQSCRIGAAALLAGCASSNPPLLFGDHATFGLHLGNDTASAGAAVSLGYKHRSIAVVPVSTLDQSGDAKALKAHAKGGKDALSVFAVFESTGSAPAGTTDSAVRLGQVFSTGMAAQMLTEGYACRARGDAACPSPKPETVAAATAPATATVLLPPAAVVHAPATSVAAVSEPSNRPYQRPLVFMRTDVFGFDIGGSAAEQGAQFGLGYASRNLALIPVVATGAGGKVSRLTGEDGDSDGTRDSYSVLGQFKSDTQTRRLGFGLERFFATGMAAQNLGAGVQAAIANEGPKTEARAPAVQPLQTAATR
jgi:hypothetical protein